MAKNTSECPRFGSNGAPSEMSVILGRLNSQFDRDWARIARIFGTNEDALRAWLGEIEELHETPQLGSFPGRGDSTRTGIGAT